MWPYIWVWRRWWVCLAGSCAKFHSHLCLGSVSQVPLLLKIYTHTHTHTCHRLPQERPWSLLRWLPPVQPRHCDTGYKQVTIHWQWRIHKMILPLSQVINSYQQKTPAQYLNIQLLRVSLFNGKHMHALVNMESTKQAHRLSTLKYCLQFAANRHFHSEKNHWCGD